jgi:hypothetical protein
MAGDDLQGAFILKGEGIMQNKEIVKEEREDGSLICHYSGFKFGVEGVEERTRTNLIDVFDLMMGRFKFYLDTFSPEGEEDIRQGVVLSPIIKEAEKELKDIAQFISDHIGEVEVIYDESGSYANFIDQEVAGIVFNPVNGKAEVTA